MTKPISRAEFLRQRATYAHHRRNARRCELRRIRAIFEESLPMENPQLYNADSRHRYTLFVTNCLEYRSFFVTDKSFQMVSYLITVVIIVGVHVIGIGIDIRIDNGIGIGTDTNTNVTASARISSADTRAPMNRALKIKKPHTGVSRSRPTNLRDDAARDTNRSQDQTSECPANNLRNRTSGFFSTKFFAAMSS